ncbi:GNAT family N-acetyltransferase [Siccirubricoccus sp. KC 17139]|uniref:GNAT family N-acetyltransferase n=1 Tax=Siccirubricoccus soli TaxID=2899147 RepID=A0ABT1D2M5_9PROT|nr:GNAT family N-acetyltransferase [Siccirubricoccus soli]MCO6416183.1 GNAT family N-acetyltransferase [Siccirubricoccus soli]MCP2682317.1 GNAT family N-acetyltransferase [Siccirubricoccus soli]
MTVTVAQATRSNLNEILRWLKQEDEETGEGFWCNRTVVESCHRDGELLVLREDGEAVAFLAGRVWVPDILEVRPDRRGRGHGRLLAEHVVAEASRIGDCLLRIECQPASSIPFWERMGFRLYRDDEEARILGGHAYRVLGRTHARPEGPAVAVEVELYPEARSWNPAVRPLLSRRLEAARREDGRLQLPERVVLFSPDVPRPPESFVRIAIDGQDVFLDKAKRDEAKAVGVERDPGGTYYVDALR